MSNPDYKPRFAFEITDEQKARADRLLAGHGQRRATFSPILDDVLDMIEEHGQVICGLIGDERARAVEIVPSMAKAKKKLERLRE